MVGDSVNVAARIEGLTKIYRAPLLIGESTYSGLASPSDFCIRLVDEVKVKGRATPVKLYEVFDEDPAELKQRKLDSLGEYYEAIHNYHERRFSVALAQFMRCRALLPEDEVLRSYAERCDAAMRGNESALSASG